jgi:hypothetical protein
MDPITLIILLVLGWFALKGGAFASLGISTNNQPAPPQGFTFTPVQSQGFTSNQAGQAIQGVNAATSALSGALETGSKLSKAVPIIGGIVDSLISVFSAQSQKRAAQARDENSAVAQAVPGWDANIRQIVSAYNNGQISGAQAKTLINTIWGLYWQEVTPRIQPDRNGCNGGTVDQPSNVSFCGGKQYGAACCVGYDDLKNSNNNMYAAIDLTEKNGQVAPANILPVFASKYGGINRPAYVVTFKRSSSMFKL